MYKEKKKGKVIVSILMVCILFLTMFTVAGCGKKTIVGVWVAESDGEKIYFNEDGACDNIPYSSHYLKYKVFGDGNIVFYDEWNQKKHVNLADSIDEAKEESSTYYLDGDLLVIDGDTYNREW